MDDTIQFPIAKAASAWAAVGVTSWAEAASAATVIASALAALYTLLLLSEWFWKRLWKPVFVRYGWFGFKRRAPASERSQ